MATSAPAARRSAGPMVWSASTIFARRQIGGLLRRHGQRSPASSGSIAASTRRPSLRTLSMKRLCMMANSHRRGLSPAQAIRRVLSRAPPEAILTRSSAESRSRSSAHSAAVAVSSPSMAALCPSSPIEPALAGRSKRQARRSSHRHIKRLASSQFIRRRRSR